MPRRSRRFERVLILLAALVLVTPAVFAGITVVSTSSFTVAPAQRVVNLVASGTGGCNPVVGANQTSATLSFTGAAASTDIGGCLRVSNPSAGSYGVKVRYVGSSNLSRIAEFRTYTENTTLMQVTNGVVTTASGPWQTVNNQISIDFRHRELAGPATTLDFEFIVQQTPTTPLSGTYALYPVRVTLGAT